MPVKPSVQSSIWELDRESLRLLEEPLCLRDEVFESARSFEPEVMVRTRRTKLDAARPCIMPVEVGRVATLENRRKSLVLEPEC